ncbi:MAG: FAD-dependent oxidoreductase [Kiritimatiellae bacterium]|nr:FAD-dependent oxidoreductase [Kiritimatiellia bacterium]
MKVTLPKELELKHRAEVIVLGGGPGGIGAAVAAAREGKDVLLVEHYGYLGGMASMGEVNPFMPNHLDGESLDKGIYTEWTDGISYYSGVTGNKRVIDPPSASLAAEDICLEAGVKLLFHHRLVSVETEGGKITGLVLHSKDGLSVVQADIYIDSTGDGDLAAMAGCPFEMGGESSDAVQPMTMCFKLRVDAEDLAYIAELCPENPAIRFAKTAEIFEQIQNAYLVAKADGRIECPRQNILMFPGTDYKTIHFNSSRVISKSAIDGDELSEAEIEGRRQVRQIFECLRRDVPIFKHSRIHSIATQIGVRESRRISGHNYMVRQDFIDAAKYDDGIIRVNYPIDIHSPTGGGTEITELPDGEWYEVPYGCLVPKGIDNLLIGCRAISVDHAVHSSMRVMPPVVSVGQAAGVAAAVALDKNITPAEVDGIELKKLLIKRGRNLV